MKTIHVLLTITDDEAQALAFVRPDAVASFVQTIRERWEWEKRAATEMQSWSPEPQTREQRQEYAKSWGMK